MFSLYCRHPDGEYETLRQRQNGRHFADDTFKSIFLNENIRISPKMSRKFVPKGPIGTYKLLYEAVMVSLLTHKCVTRPHCIKCFFFVKDGGEGGDLCHKYSTLRLLMSGGGGGGGDLCHKYSTLRLLMSCRAMVSGH